MLTESFRLFWDMCKNGECDCLVCVQTTAFNVPMNMIVMSPRQKFKSMAWQFRSKDKKQLHAFLLAVGINLFHHCEQSQRTIHLKGNTLVNWFSLCFIICTYFILCLRCIININDVYVCLCCRSFALKQIVHTLWTTYRTL